MKLREEVAEVVENKHFMVSVMASESKVGEMKFRSSSRFSGEEIKVEGMGEEVARPVEGEEAEVIKRATPNRLDGVARPPPWPKPPPKFLIFFIFFFLKK